MDTPKRLRQKYCLADRLRSQTNQVFPSTSGEGSLIFKGAYRSRHSRLQNREIKISLCLLNFEGCGTLDLGEIYQFGPWKRFAFDFRQHTFAHPRWNHTPGAPALRTCVFALFPPFRRPPFATSSTTLAPGPPCKRFTLNFRHFTFAVPPSSPKHLRQQNHCGAERRG